MSTAEQLIAMYKDYNELIAACDEQAHCIEQDWNKETTTYILVDDSYIRDCNGEIYHGQYL